MKSNVQVVPRSRSLRGARAARPTGAPVHAPWQILPLAPACTTANGLARAGVLRVMLSQAPVARGAKRREA
eukprot:6174443-Pleurochrysis_carterae.AAC.5